MAEEKGHNGKRVLQLKNEVFLPLVLEYVEHGKTAEIPLKGVSMRPFLETERDVGILSKARAFKKGDVVLAEIEKGHFVLHRIDRITLDGKNVKGLCDDPQADVTLRGDGNPKGTEHCKLKDVRALCGKVIRKGKLWNLQKSKRWKVYSWYWTHTLFMRRYQLAAFRLVFRHELPKRWKRK